MGFSAVFDRHIVNHLVVGLRGAMSNNQTGITNTEGGLFVRAYPIKVGLGGAFVQAGGGVTFFQEEELRKPAMFLDYSAGYRFFFLGGFYAEAHIRTGYPFQWAIGALAGHRFNF